MRRVIIESPYAGSVELNLRYLRACMHDSLMRGEAPFASHGLYTQPGVLDDTNPVQRMTGIHAGFAWRDIADATIVYTDLGISRGMQYGIDHAEGLGMTVEHRALGKCWSVLATFSKTLPDCLPWTSSDQYDAWLATGQMATSGWSS